MCTALHSDSVDGWETFGDIFLPSYETGLIAFLKRIFIFSKKTKLLGKSCNEECLSLWLREWLSNEHRATSIFTVKRRKEEDGTINWFFTLTLASLPFLEFSIFSGATRQGWDVIVWGCNPRSILWSFHKSCWMSKEKLNLSVFFCANQIFLASALFCVE